MPSFFHYPPPISRTYPPHEIMREWAPFSPKHSTQFRNPQKNTHKNYNSKCRIPRSIQHKNLYTSHQLASSTNIYIQAKRLCMFVIVFKVYFCSASCWFLNFHPPRTMGNFIFVPPHNVATETFLGILCLQEKAQCESRECTKLK